MKNCEYCGKAMTNVDSHNRPRRFCSRTCAGLSHVANYKGKEVKAIVTKTCEICGKEFPVWNYRADSAVVCSYACRGKLQTKRFGKYVKPRSITDDYEKTRKSILERDHHSCLICGSKRKVSVHHVDHDTSNNDPKNLATLCAYCHAKELWYRDEYESTIRKLMSST